MAIRLYNNNPMINRCRKNENDSWQNAFANVQSVLAQAMFAAVLLAFCIPASLAAETGAPIPPEKFSDDYYKVYGTPNLTISLDQTRIYQGEQTCFFDSD